MTFKEYINNQSKLLSDWVKEDQKERAEYKDFVHNVAARDYEKGAELWAKLKNRPKHDVFNDAKRLKRFINTKFNYDEFSKKDWNNYWLLAQHADFDADFQRNALTVIVQYLGTDNSHYKYLSDRISMAEKGTQLYNTQNPNS
jgi:hypothetical protein